MLNLFDIKVVGTDIAAMLKFLPVTLYLTLWSMVLGLLLGFVIAIIRIKKIKVLNQLAVVFISVIRGTPIIVQLYVSYFGIPIFLQYLNYWNGTDYNVAAIPPIIYAIAALALNQAAYNSVVISSALEAVDKGQVEAAQAIGMTGWQSLRRIVIPEAVEIAIQPLGNTLIGLIKGTSLAFSCSVIEMTAQGKILAGRDYRYFEAYVALAVIYWALVIVLEQIIRLISKAVKVPDVVGKNDSAKIAVVECRGQ